MATPDRIPYRHDAGPPLTVGDLRKALKDAPDDATVMAHTNDQPWHGDSSGWYAQRVELLPASSSGIHPGPRVELYCTPRSGTILRPRPGWLVVEHGEAKDADVAAAHEGLKQAVHDAVAATGYRGRSTGFSSGPTTTWEWESANVLVTEVVAAAEAAAAALNPGAWGIRSELG